MRNPKPSVVVLAGPNGAGKSTTAPTLLKGTLRVTEFVNADVIARGLSGFAPQGAALAASQIMLKRLEELTRANATFAFETTLAGRSLAGRLRNMAGIGYEVQLVFLSLPSADLAVSRVAARVAMGGHDVPESTVRRRYAAGLRNFFRLYRPLSDTWRMYDNARRMRMIAMGDRTAVERVFDKPAWDYIMRTWS